MFYHWNNACFSLFSWVFARAEKGIFLRQPSVTFPRVSPGGEQRLVMSSSLGVPRSTCQVQWFTVLTTTAQQTCSCTLVCIYSTRKCISISSNYGASADKRILCPKSKRLFLIRRLENELELVPFSPESILILRWRFLFTVYAFASSAAAEKRISVRVVCASKNIFTFSSACAHNTLSCVSVVRVCE